MISKADLVAFSCCVDHVILGQVEEEAALVLVVYLGMGEILIVYLVEGRDASV